MSRLQKYYSLPILIFSSIGKLFPALVLAIIIFQAIGCSSHPPISPTSTPVEEKPTSPISNYEITKTQTQESNQIQITSSPRTDLQTEFSTYTGPEELFKLDYPASWLINESNFSTQLSNPSGVEHVDLLVINTGYPLSDDAFLRLIKARENNKFTTFENYILLGDLADYSKADLSVLKQFNSEDGVKIVVSSYYRIDHIVLAIDCWSNRDAYTKNEATFKALLNSVTFNNNSISNFNEYPYINYCNFDSNYYSIEAPCYWEYQHSDEDNSKIDTFKSPDDRFILQHIIYDDGEIMSKNIGGDFVLFLLNEYYAKDIRVVSDKVSPPGREGLSWFSESSGYLGTTYFEVQANKLFILTTLVDPDYASIYNNFVNQIMSTYVIQTSP